MRKSGLGIVLFFVFCSGCLPSVVASPFGLRATPPTPEHVSRCETTRSWHNVWVVVGALFGAASGGSGVSSLVSDDSGVRLGIAIAAAVSGGISTLATTLAGLTAETYATENCQSVLEQADALKKHE